MGKCDSDYLCTHEILMVNRLLNFVLHKAVLYEATKIVSISIEIGHFIKGNPFLIQKYFQEISSETIANMAVLDIRKKREIIKCSQCNLLYFSNTMYLNSERCPKCNELQDISPKSVNCYIKEITIE